MEPENTRPHLAWISIWPIVVAFLINSVSLSLIYARLKTTALVKPSSTDEVSSRQYQQILDELQSIHKIINQTASLEPQTATPTLGTNTEYTGQLSDLLTNAATPVPAGGPTPTPAGYITLTSSPNGQVDVYKESASFSPIIDQIVSGQKYPYLAKLNNWYHITLPSGKNGWINSQFVKETP